MNNTKNVKDDVKNESSGLKRILSSELFKNYNNMYTLIFIILVSVTAVIIRTRMFEFMSGDMNIYIIPWFEKIKSEGGFRALSGYIGDYTPPYYYIIAVLTYLPFEAIKSVKFVSCVFDFIMAVFAAKIVYELTKKLHSAVLGYALCLFTPTVFMNSGIWGQCDSIYTCFLIISIYYIIKNKQALSMIFYGIAFAFKLQAVFIAPYFLVLLIKKKLSPKKIILFPIALFAMMIPAMLCGDSIFRIFGIYFKQADEYNLLSYSIANIYSFLNGMYIDIIANKSICVYITGAVVLMLVYYFVMKNYEITNRHIVVGFALFAFVLPYLLPHMHERYYYPAIVIGLILAVSDRKFLPYFVAAEICAAVPQTVFLYGNSLDHTLWNVLSVTVIVIIYNLFKKYENLIKENEIYKE